ncbi:membrane protein [Bordetella petrii]|uniref:Membrane protein n=1 Tax=Bordetella petrii (strain ATCC BAA-461 / DSM 12804 / CCUG 43448 / CIP 107267 / Se-1111R) TaxID=340100 RepID=A9IFQ9_BORPD|nr:membrane protein [Bordetella petrii]CAP45082.1 putative membrane protein [Bordetella petrii]
MNSIFNPPSTDEREALLREIGPLPLSGQAWPDWVRILAWIILAIIGVQIVSSAIRLPPGQVSGVLTAIVVLCFLGLVLVSWHMQKSITTIDETGLRQTWITRREVAWHEIQFAKFVPLMFSKRLVVFTQRGRPVVFQGGTRELQIAFAKISLLYRRKR